MQAATAFDKVVKSDPDDAEALYGRGVSDECSGQYDAAIGDLDSAIRLDPRWRAYRARGIAYEQTGDYARALADFDAAIDLNPGEPSIYLERASLYARSGQVSAAIADLNTATAVAGRQSPYTYFDGYAWLLATSPAGQLRNGPMAVKYATYAADMTIWQNGLILDTLAAAYAENDQFDQAVKWQKKACELQWENDPARTPEFQKMHARLALYEKQQPYREEPIAMQGP